MNKMSITDPFGSSNLSFKGKLIYIFQMNHPFQVIKIIIIIQTKVQIHRYFYYMRVHFLKQSEV